MNLLNYRTLGKGPYLFILHGMYGMSDNWMSIARAISENFTDERLLNFLLKNLGKKQDGTFYWMLNLAVLISSLENMALGFDNLSALSGFPVHFVRGERSFYIQPEHYPSMKKLYPVHDITTIPDAGHWLHHEQPGLISEFIIKMRNNDNL